ncbi:MAG: ATP synthase F1 subunit gamma [Candidatus Binataceae bacterium]
MASLKAIRRRIASVKSTQQITRAMKLVAAARLRRAQEALVAARPYSQALARVADSLLTSEGIDIAPPEGARKTALIAVVGSDRGLCGGYNSYLLRAAEDSLRATEREGLKAGYFAIGKKAVDHFRRDNAPISAQSQDNLPKLATIGLARKIAARMLSDYQTGAISEAAIVYTEFKSAISQRPVYERLLPVVKPQSGAKDADAQPIDYLVEPSRAELVPVVLRSYLEAAVFNALLQAEASEQGARMTAMDSATNNAIEMIGAYTLEMNRARQAQITRELMDIVGGAEALRG